jgi:aminoglycoside phosphotransferase (APT) family kinase protein
VTDRIPPVAIDVNESLVRALLAEQHPDFESLPLTTAGAGWDNMLYRLGATLAVRLPRRAEAVALIEHEQRWLPELAPRLPLPIPLPVRRGRPGQGFPWPWSIVPWLPGDNATIAPVRDTATAALALGAFVRAMHRPAPPGAPSNPYRGIPLRERTAVVRDRAGRLEGIVESAAVLAMWDEMVRTPLWPGPPLWIHGDLHPGNLLVHEGRLSAVIDFGDLTSGDPATDLAVAWMLLPPPMRLKFREAAAGPAQPIDDDTWTRARGWALAFGVIFLASARDRLVHSGVPGPASQMMAAIGRTTIDAVLADRPS